MTRKKIRKAVFPVAGLGTRFLPATKALPKEMLPLLDKPLIQYAVEEARAAGIEEFIFVTGRGKTAIEDHFDQAFELEFLLRQRQRDDEMACLSSVTLQPGSISYTRQQVPLGLGHAVWCARHLVGDEPFAVLLADDFIRSPIPCLKQMMDAYDTGHMLAVMDVPHDHVSRYGIVEIAHENQNLLSLEGVVEKPTLDAAPSCTAVIGRYILDSGIFHYLEAQGLGSGGEIQLTDALDRMKKDGTSLWGLRFVGKRYDCGSKAGFMAANVRVAMDDPGIASLLIQEWEDIQSEKKHKNGDSK